MLRISQNIKYKDISVKVTDSPSANSNSKKIKPSLILCVMVSLNIKGHHTNLPL